MHPLLRKAIAIAVGLFVGCSLMIFIEGFSPYQPPEGVTYVNGGWPYLDWIRNLPTDGWMILLGSLFAGSLVGGFVTHKITPPAFFPVSLLTGFLMLFYTIGKYMGFASPAWMTYASCIGSVAFGWLGGWLAHLNYKSAVSLDT